MVDAATSDGSIGLFDKSTFYQSPKGSEKKPSDYLGEEHTRHKG